MGYHFFYFHLFPFFNSAIFILFFKTSVHLFFSPPHPLFFFTNIFSTKCTSIPQLSQPVLSHFVNHRSHSYTYSYRLSFLILSLLVTPLINFNISISETLIFYSFFLSIDQHSEPYVIASLLSLSCRVINLAWLEFCYHKCNIATL